MSAKHKTSGGIQRPKASTNPPSHVVGPPVTKADTIPYHPPPTPAADVLVPPFLNPDQQQALDSILHDAQTQYDDILKSVKTATVNTDYQKTLNDQDARQSKSNSTDSAIARGLFQSSIKDAQLYDIEAQRSMRKQYLDDNLLILTQDAQRKTDALFGPAGSPGHVNGGFVGTSQMNSNRQAVGNAQSITPAVPPKPAAKPAPKPAGYGGPGATVHQTAGTSKPAQNVAVAQSKMTPYVSPLKKPKKPVAHI